VCEALRSCAPPPSPKGIDDKHGSSSDNVEHTISDEIAGATRRLLANQDRIAALEEKVSQIQLLLSNNLQHTFTGTSFIGPHNILNEMQSEHHVSPQRLATPVSPQRNDGHSHATPVRADSIDGQKQITRAEPDAGQGQLIRDGPDANDVLLIEDTVVRANPDAGQGQLICDMPHATEVVPMEVTAIKAEPDVAQGKVIPHRPNDTHVEQVEGTTVRAEPDVVEGQVSSHRDEPTMPVVDNGKVYRAVTSAHYEDRRCVHFSYFR